MPIARPERTRDDGHKLRTALGWLTGGTVGLLASYGLFLALGPSYPVDVGTFVAFCLGAFAGMRIADVVGPKGTRWLALSAGTAVALAVAVLVSTVLASR